jgi:hypothetical protein
MLKRRVKTFITAKLRKEAAMPGLIVYIGMAPAGPAILYKKI